MNTEANNLCDIPDYNEKISNRLIYDEERKYGKIPTRIYMLYLKSCGLYVVLVFCVSALGWQAFRIYTDVWLRGWTDIEYNNNNNVVADDDDELQQQQQQSSLRHRQQQQAENVSYYAVQTNTLIYSLCILMRCVVGNSTPIIPHSMRE